MLLSNNTKIVLQIVSIFIIMNNFDLKSKGKDMNFNFPTKLGTNVDGMGDDLGVGVASGTATANRI